MQMKINSLPSLEDDQLKTPQHDEMCIKLLNKELLLSLIAKDTNLQKKICYEIPKPQMTYLIEYSSLIHKKITIEIKQTIVEQTKLEHPVFVGNNKFLVGYIDLLCGIRTNFIETIVETKYTYDKWFDDSLREELNTYEKREAYMQSHPLCKETTSTNVHNCNTQISFAIEVKPKIKSVGEVLRQLQSYSSYLHCPIVLFTKDLQFKDVFEGQGFSFWGDEQ